MFPKTARRRGFPSAAAATRLFAVLAALALLAGCGAQEAQAPVYDPASVEALIAGWSGLLYLVEGDCADALWTLDYADAFLAAPSRDTLTLAHAAAAAGLESVSVRSAAPDTDFDAAALPERLAEAPALSVARNMAAGGWAEERAACMDLFLSLSDALSGAVFDTEGMESLTRWVSRERELSGALLAYWAELTGDLLSRVDDATLRARGRAALAASCPRISALLPAQAAPAEEIAGESVPDGGGEAIQMAEARVAALRQEREGFPPPASDAPAGEVSVILGLDALLPAPDWDAAYAARSLWYWEQEDGTVSVATAGEELTVPPTGCRITWPGVAPDALRNYQERLAALGIAPLAEPGIADGAYTVCYERGGLPVVFRQAGHGEVTADMPDGYVALAPEYCILS